MYGDPQWAGTLAARDLRILDPNGQQQMQPGMWVVQQGGGGPGAGSNGLQMQFLCNVAAPPNCVSPHPADHNGGVIMLQHGPPAALLHAQGQQPQPQPQPHNGGGMMLMQHVPHGMHVAQHGPPLGNGGLQPGGQMAGTCAPSGHPPSPHHAQAQQMQMQMQMQMQPQGQGQGGQGQAGQQPITLRAQAELELELSLRGSLLVEQQRRIVQLEEELQKSWAEVSCLPTRPTCMRARTHRGHAPPAPARGAPRPPNSPWPRCALPARAVPRLRLAQIQRLRARVATQERERKRVDDERGAKQPRYWTSDEHRLFLEAIEK